MASSYIERIAEGNAIKRDIRKQNKWRKETTYIQCRLYKGLKSTNTFSQNMKTFQFMKMCQDINSIKMHFDIFRIDKVEGKGQLQHVALIAVKQALQLQNCFHDTKTF